MTTRKTFTAADIVTATGTMVSPRMIEAVYDVLGHLTGGEPVHPRAATCQRGHDPRVAPAVPVAR